MTSYLVAQDGDRVELLNPGPGRRRREEKQGTVKRSWSTPVPSVTGRACHVEMDDGTALDVHADDLDVLR